MRAYSDEHWDAVVDAYREGGRKPGPYVAARFGVPVTTAHRWFRELRLRGLLDDRATCLLNVATEVGVEPSALYAAIQKHAPGWKVSPNVRMGVTKRPRRTA